MANGYDEVYVQRLKDRIIELEARKRGSVVQAWLSEIPMMQQTVLLECTRGPDTLRKYHPAKYLLRWYRRCVLLSAMDGVAITDPLSPNGGSFTGPIVDAAPHGGADRWENVADRVVDNYLRDVDEVPHHFHLHLMHAVEILGYKHPNRRIREWWRGLYYRLVKDMHLEYETEVTLDHRLGDSRKQWLEHADPATRA